MVDFWADHIGRALYQNNSVVCLSSVVTRVHCAKTAEPIGTNFGTSVAPYENSTALKFGDDHPSASLRVNCCLGELNVNFPPIAQQLSDVVIAGDWAYTWDDRRHLSCLDNNWGMAVFLTDDNARRPALHREAYVRYVAVTRYLLTEPSERLHTRADSW